MFAILYRDQDELKTWIKTTEESTALKMEGTIIDAELYVDYLRYIRAKEECERLREELREIKSICDRNV